MKFVNLVQLVDSTQKSWKKKNENRTVQFSQRRSNNDM